MNLIGISGLAGSGKSESARALMERMGFVEMSLADPMKRAVMEWVPGWGPDVMWGPSANRNAPDERYGGCTPRKMLQRLGTEVGRECYPNVWVDIAIRTARRILDRAGLDRVTYDRARGIVSTTEVLPLRPLPVGVVISDVRFRNELDAVHAVGGKVIRIVRPGAGLSGESAMHASEVEQLGIPDDAFDAVLANAGTIVQLHGSVCVHVAAMLGLSCPDFEKGAA